MPRHAIHPGEHLAEQLEALKMSAAKLARQLKVPTNRIYAYPRRTARDHWGHGAASGALIFGTSAEFWLNLQKLYELRVAEHQVGDDIKGLPRLRDRAA